MYKVWLFGSKEETLKTFKTLKEAHAHLVSEYETKKTYGQLKRAMRDFDNDASLYFYDGLYVVRIVKE